MCREEHCPNAAGDLCPACTEERRDLEDRQAQADTEWRELMAPHLKADPCFVCGADMRTEGMCERADSEYECERCHERHEDRAYERLAETWGVL